jgi:lipopolysaccharide/colanic/teichoic acid biosynthesis glycosyltransferase
VTKNVLSTVLEKTLTDFPNICNPNYKPDSDTKKTGMSKKLKMIIIIVGAVIGLILLIIIIAVATSK